MAGFDCNSLWIYVQDMGYKRESMTRSKTRTGGLLSSEAGRAACVVCHRAWFWRYAVPRKTMSNCAAFVEGRENNTAENEVVVVQIWLLTGQT